VYVMTRRSGGSSGSVGSTCTSDANCAAPLVCDATAKTCRRKPGDVCTESSNCVTGTACSGGKCLGAYDAPCTQDNECASPGACVGNEGTTCSTVQKICKNGVNDCLMPGLTSSQVACTKVIGSALPDKTGACALLSCVAGASCIGNSGNQRCVFPDGSLACNADNECLDGATCNLATHRCEVPLCGLLTGMQCSVIEDCKLGNVCDIFLDKPECRLSSGSVCSKDSECVKDATCKSGKCTNRKCGKNGDCFSDEVCAFKQCVPKVCLVDSDCIDKYMLGAGWKCEHGTDVNVRTCVSSGYDCPNQCIANTQICNGKICTSPIGDGCGTDADCTSGVCDQATSECIAKTCATTEDCTTQYPACNPQKKCVACFGNSSCPPARPNCQLDGTCTV